MASKSKRDVPFQEVKIFNERSSPANVQVQICQNRVEAPVLTSPMLEVAANGQLDPPWQPSDQENIKSILVSTYLADGTTNDVTFGKTGVGLQFGTSDINLVNVKITLSGTSTVQIDLCDIEWNVLRTAYQKPLPTQPESGFVELMSSNGQAVMQLFAPSAEWGNGIVVGPPVDPSPQRQQWSIVVAATNPTNYFFQCTTGSTTCALGRWASPNPSVWNAGQVVPPQVDYAKCDQMIVVFYRDGGGVFQGVQIVDIDMGFALSAVNKNSGQQLQFALPDSVDSSEQLWNIGTD
jgi:hypothetical protein